MANFEVPLTPQPQRFEIQLGLETYVLRLSWNTASACWILNISDSDDVLLVGGIPLVTGVDLLQPFGYLGIPGQLFVQTDNNLDAVPTFDNLGLTAHVFFITSE